MAKIRDYKDFILALDDYDEKQETYTVQLVPGLWGELAKVTVNLNYPEIEEALSSLEDDAIDGDELAGLGKALADRLLPVQSRLREKFVNAVKACGTNSGIRMRLMIHPPRLQQLPWEYTLVKIFEAMDERSQFIVLNPKISLVRHPAMDADVSPLKLGDRTSLRLLAAMANPQVPGLGEINLKKEKKQLEKVFADFKVDGLKFDWQPIQEGVTIEDLRDALLKKPDLFHFSGHGKFLKNEAVGSLVLVKDKQADPVEAAFISAGTVADLLSNAGVRVAYLGACESSRLAGNSPWAGIAPALIGKGVPVVIAMQYEVDDAMAIEFSRAFYMSLAAGLTVDEAVTNGRLAVLSKSEEDDVQWGVPTLYLRAENGVLFEDLTGRSSQTAEGLRAALDMVIGTVEQGGKVTGINFKRDPVSGNFIVNMKIEVVKGNVTGISFDNL